MQGIPFGWPPEEPSDSDKPDKAGKAGQPDPSNSTEPREEAGELPEEEDFKERVVPLFPLSSVFLVPGTILPLHIFEPRYRQMMEDSLDGPGRIVIGTVLPGYEGEMPGAPPVNHIAGMGEIVKHERMPDGRFLMVLLGLCRVEIREAPSDRLYRKVTARAIRDVLPQEEAIQDNFRQRLEEAILSRNTELLNLPDHLGVGNLADLLMLQLKLPSERMLQLYSEKDVSSRAEQVLAEHLKRKSQRPPSSN